MPAGVWYATRMDGKPRLRKNDSQSFVFLRLETRHGLFKALGSGFRIPRFQGFRGFRAISERPLLSQIEPNSFNIREFIQHSTFGNAASGPGPRHPIRVPHSSRGNGHMYGPSVLYGQTDTVPEFSTYSNT
jgi:hypothetical protein